MAYRIVTDYNETLELEDAVVNKGESMVLTNLISLLGEKGLLTEREIEELIGIWTVEKIGGTY